MHVSRKTFLKSSALLAGGVLFGANKTLGKILFDENGFKTLRNNIGIFLGQGGTIACYISDDAAVVIDTQNPDSAKNFMNVLKEKTTRKIDLLFNTHHHGDHTSGNYYLRQFADKIVAQENCPVLQKKAYGEGEKAAMQVYADTTFKEQWHKDLGKEKITASYLGGAHTGGDSIIHFENANIAHVGDIVFNRVYPYIDQNGGGSIKGWVEVLEKAEKKYSNDTLFVFGHADIDDNVTGKKEDLTKIKNYLSALLDFVDKEKKSGKSLDEIKLAKEIPGFSDIKERWQGAFGFNLEAAFNELNKI